MPETPGSAWEQIKSANRHGTQPYGQASDGTGASGNLPKFNADGSLTDSGIATASLLRKYTTNWISQTSVTVTHNLATTDVIVRVYDGSDVQVQPESVTTASTNVVTLTFGAAFTGRVVVIG